MALSKGDADTVKRLLEEGVNVTQKDQVNYISQIHTVVKDRML